MIFSILSWNILGELRMFSERQTELFRILKNYSNFVDIMCFQEVIDMHNLHLNLKDSYKFNHSNDKLMIFSKFPIYDLEVFELPRAGWPKSLISLKIKFEDGDQKSPNTDQKSSNADSKSVLIATSHFLPEFGEKNVNKIYQYQKTDDFLKSQKIENMIFVSDFNVISSDEDSFYLDWNDAYKDCGSIETEKYSFDYLQNKFALGEYRCRLDRILYRGNLKPISFRLIKEGNPTPSDHFGLLSEFLI